MGRGSRVIGNQVIGRVTHTVETLHATSLLLRLRQSNHLKQLRKLTQFLVLRFEFSDKTVDR